jgi:hypothetical protein
MNTEFIIVLVKVPDDYNNYKNENKKKKKKKERIFDQYHTNSSGFMKNIFRRATTKRLITYEERKSPSLLKFPKCRRTANCQSSKELE